MSFLFGSSAANATLSGLFSSNSRPVKQSTSILQKARTEKVPNDETLSSAEDSDEDIGSVEAGDEAKSDAVGGVTSDVLAEEENSSKHRKHNGMKMPLEVSAEEKRSRRKRKRDDDDLEGAYMQRLAKDEAKEEEQHRVERQSKKPKADQKSPDTNATQDEPPSDEDDDDDHYVPPKHETIGDSGIPSDVEKASRTIFVGNVSISAITNKSDKKVLTAHLSSFLSELPSTDPMHKIYSIRFRSVAFSSHIPKKAAFARQDLMETTTKSTNAYVVYSTKVAAREAAKRLNGTVILDRHIRVDEVAHPAKVDHHRCVFVGNLGFVDDESQMKANEASQGHHQPRKAQNGDVEEGLWRQFGKAGTVESVRVIRDPKTRVGKGIAYVQFTDENAVEAALLFNDKRYPPLLPRKLRVTRAKKFKRNQPSSAELSGTGKRPIKGGESRDRNQQSIRGRVKKMLGRAGAAKLRDSNGHDLVMNGKSVKPREVTVFEGHRASSTQGNRSLKLRKTFGKKGKPTSRSARRGGAWKAKAGKTG